MNEDKITFLELYQAYLDCRKHKRNTINALAFEIDYETNLLQLFESINNGTYKIGSSIAFVIHKPVDREVFAADFKDRIVHHLIINKLNPIFEKLFIYDSYSCRVGKGTHFGINRIDHFIRSCSNNYQNDCYILKLDIQGFFMHINRDILWQKVKIQIENKYFENDKVIILNLCRQIIENDPTKNCVIKGSQKEWENLPENKSLFHSPPNCGLPIGNLTSQVFANLYMNSFDHFIKNNLQIKYYGRYVDDFIIVHQNKVFLKSIIFTIKEYLKTELGLNLHPNKIYLQHFTKGVKYIGAVVKPYRLYIHNRTKSNLYESVYHHNFAVKNHRPDTIAIKNFIASINSYFGLMRKYKTYKLRKNVFYNNFSGYWLNYVSSCGGYAKIKRKVI